MDAPDAREIGVQGYHMALHTLQGAGQDGPFELPPVWLPVAPDFTEVRGPHEAALARAARKE